MTDIAGIAEIGEPRPDHGGFGDHGDFGDF